MLLAAACDRSPTGSYRAAAAAPARVATQSQLGGVRVSWEPVDGADGYVLHAGTAGTFELSSDMTTVTVTALQPHILYSFSVATRERASLSAASAPVRGSVLTGRESRLDPVFSAEPGLPISNLANMGGAIAPAGDVDLDGHPDFWVGISPAFRPGEARLYYGAPTTVVDHLRTAAIPGPCAQCAAGFRLASGDLDGDGRTDLLMTEPRFTSSMARLTAYRGAPVGVSTALSWAAVGPTTSFIALAAGDLNGDGNDDVLTGAQSFTTAGLSATAGRIDVFFGPGPMDGSTHTASITLFGDSSPRLGSALAVADIDGDGIEDALVGASSEVVAGIGRPGRVHVFLGSSSGIAVSADASFDGTVDGGRFGNVLGLFDLDADGRAEIVLAEPSANEQRGRVCVHRLDAGSPVLDLCLEGRQIGERFGSALGSADVNGDGASDLLVTSETSRVISLFVGTPVGLDPVALFAVEGNEPGAGVSFGSTVVGVGDLDGDGLDDVAVGEPTFSTSTIIDQGRLWTYQASRVSSTGPHADAGLVSSSVAGSTFRPQLPGASDPAGLPLQCSWSWGDGSPDTEISACAPGTLAAAEHVFANPGTFVLRLRVTTADGRAAEAITTVFVTAGVAE